MARRGQPNRSLALIERAGRCPGRSGSCERPSGPCKPHGRHKRKPNGAKRNCPPPHSPPRNEKPSFPLASFWRNLMSRLCGPCFSCSPGALAILHAFGLLCFGWSAAILLVGACRRFFFTASSAGLEFRDDGCWLGPSNGRRASCMGLLGGAKLDQLLRCLSVCRVFPSGVPFLRRQRQGPLSEGACGTK